MRKEGFNVINKASKIAPGLAQVRAFIKSADGTRRFFITKKCKETKRSLLGYQYDSTNSGIIKEEALKDGLHDHLCDQIRYFIINRFDTAKYVAKDLDQRSITGTKKEKCFKRCIKCHSLFLSYTPKSQPPFHCNNCKE